MGKGTENEKLVTFEKVPLERDQPFCVRVQKIGRTTLHWHEGITEILMPLRGEILVTAGFESHTLREGEFNFINHRSIHSLQSEEEAVALLIHINLSCFTAEFPYLHYMFFRSKSFEDPLVSEASFQDIGQEEKARFRAFLLDLLKREATRDMTDQDRYHLGNRLVYDMVFEFNWLRLLKSAEGLINSSHMERYHRIVKYIQEHYAERISLEDVASGEYITKTYLSQFWKKFSSYSFTLRVNYERILKSEFMLLSGQSILQISEQCGFSDVKYYYQNFRKWFGCLPTEHRKNCREYHRLGEALEEVLPASLLQDLIDGPGISGYPENNRLIVNPFVERASDGSAGRAKEDEIQWDPLDTAVRIHREVGHPIAIEIPLPIVEGQPGIKRARIFLEQAKERYGAGVLEGWRFHLMHEGPPNSEHSDKSMSIEGLIHQEIHSPHIRHYYKI